MSETLHTRLEAVPHFIELYTVSLIPESWKIIEDARNSIKKHFIEHHRKKSHLLEEVIAGKTSFLKVGKPIIDRCGNLEDGIKQKNGLGYFKKKDLLESPECKEISDMLLKERLINPNKYFHSRFLLPEPITKTNTKIIDKFIFKWMEKNYTLIGRIFLPFLTFGALGTAYGYLKGENTNTALTYGLFGSLLEFGMELGLTITGSIIDCFNVEKMENGKDEFKSALDYLDNEIKRVYKN